MLAGYLFHCSITPKARHFPVLDTGRRAAGREQPQPCSSSSFRECHFSHSPEVWNQSGAPGPKISSRRWICRQSFSLDNLWLKRPEAYCPGLLRAGPLWGRAVYTSLYGAHLSSVPSGDHSANPAGVSGSSGFPRALLSVSARKRSGTGRLVTSSEVFRAARSAIPCRSSASGHWASSSKYTRGQSRETGSLSRSPGGVGAPAKCLVGSCLAGSGSTSLVFLGDDAGLRTIVSIEDFSKRVRMLMA